MVRHLSYRGTDRFRSRFLAGEILLALLFTFALGLPASANPGLSVAWEAGLLSVTAEKVPLPDILTEIAHQTGLQIQGVEQLQGEVSLHFSDLPLHEGLKKLLTNVNYCFIEEHLRAPALVIVGSGTSTGSAHIVVGTGANTENKRTAVTGPAETLYELAQKGDKAALRKALSDPNPDIQAIALELLVGLDPREGVAELISATQSPHGEARLRAIELLASTEQAEEHTVLRALSAAMVDQNTAVKQYAVRALAERGGQEALGYLRQSLHDSDASVRMMVIENIVRSAPSEQRLSLLREAALDENKEVRSAASNWLEQLSQNSEESPR